MLCGVVIFPMPPLRPACALRKGMLSKHSLPTTACLVRQGDTPLQLGGGQRDGFLFERWCRGMVEEWSLVLCVAIAFFRQISLGYHNVEVAWWFASLPATAAAPVIRKHRSAHHI
jgi:hypothetical protein